MSRIPWLLLCCAGLAGCRSTLIGRALTPKAPAAESVRLFGQEVQAEDGAIQDAVVARVPPGTPLDQAQALLEDEGFSCHPYNAWGYGFNRSRFIPPELSDPKPLQGVNPEHERRCRPVYCWRYRDVHPRWGQEYLAILVLLLPEKDGTVRDVQVTTTCARHPFEKFFARQPDLMEPVGLPLAEAEALLHAHGFHCAEAARQGAGSEGRRHVLCAAADERLLGGDIIRVQLDVDEAGVVQDSEVLRLHDWFDTERSIWPDADAPASTYARKCALFPLRCGCRYALIAGGVTLYVSCYALAGAMHH